MKCLRLGGNFSNSVYAFVFAGLLKLDTLCPYTPENIELCERLVEHRGIDTVIIMNSHTLTYKLIPKLLEKLPNIRHLTLPQGCLNPIYVAIAQCLPRLEALAIKHLENAFFRGVRFRSLKALEIYSLNTKIDWREFSESHTLLTNLTVELVDNKCLNSDDIDKIASTVNLKSLKLGRGFVPDERFFEIVRNKCPDLKVLDFCKREPRISYTYLNA